MKNGQTMYVSGADLLTAAIPCERFPTMRMEVSHSNILGFKNDITEPMVHCSALTIIAGQSSLSLQHLLLLPDSQHYILYENIIGLRIQFEGASNIHREQFFDS